MFKTVSTKKPTSLEGKVSVSHDGQLSVNPNVLLQTSEAREHLKAFSKFIRSSSGKLVSHKATGKDTTSSVMREKLRNEILTEMESKSPDRKPQGTAVDGPAHYNGYQVLDMICDISPAMARGFCLGNAIKYLARAEKKGSGARDQQDLDKAQFYLDWYLERYEKYNPKKD